MYFLIFGSKFFCNSDPVYTYQRSPYKYKDVRRILERTYKWKQISIVELGLSNQNPRESIQAQIVNLGF